MKVLVTGADGFVGSRLVPRLLAEGYDVVASVRAVGAARAVDPRAQTVTLELGDAESVRDVAGVRPDAVIHLAAVSSGGEARKAPAFTQDINREGTRRLIEALADLNPLFVLASTAEVYGVGPATPRVETDPPAPCSPYGESKLGAEAVCLEAHRRSGFRVVVTRPFAHTGAGQDERFVVPAFAARLQAAKRSNAGAVKVGNLTPIREFMHVEDVVDAYVLLLEGGRPGEVYNIASGRAVSLEDLFFLLCDIVGHHAIPESDPSLMRAVDIPYLVGNAGKLLAATGWAPRRTLEDTLAEVVSAQAN